LSEGLDALPGNDPMEGRSACSDGGQIDTQEPEGLGVDDVEVAASVHKDLGEPDVADDRVDDERVFPRARHVVGVVGLVEGDCNILNSSPKSNLVNLLVSIREEKIIVFK
jgi:hypothetical protein